MTRRPPPYPGGTTQTGLTPPSDQRPRPLQYPLHATSPDGPSVHQPSVAEAVPPAKEEELISFTTGLELIAKDIDSKLRKLRSEIDSANRRIDALARLVHTLVGSRTRGNS
jgi:hypothetical protein